MGNIKAIDLIKTIPPKNYGFISDFVEKNAAKPVYKLCLFAMEASRIPSKNQEIWNKIYTSKPYKKQQFANYCHQLLLSIEQAICLISIKERNLSFYDFFLPSLLDWDALEHYQFSFRKAEKFLDDDTQHNNISFYRHRLDYFEFKRLEKESNRKTPLNINDASASLDEYYVLLKLRYLCAALSHQQITSSNYEVSFIEFLIPKIESSKLAKVPIIQNYLLVYYMLKDYEDDMRFADLKHQLHRSSHLLSASELNEIYIYPINFCIRKINSGIVEYQKELLEIYKSLPVFNIDSNEIITPLRFRNVVHLALLQKEYNWVAFFIENFSHRILKEFRVNAINYNLANLKFHEKKYDEVISLLINVEYQDINYMLNCRMLLLKTYFEMNDIEVFHSQLESFRLFIMRHKELTASIRKKYLDVLSIMRKLAKLEYANIESIEKFKTKIKSKEIIADKAWILEQLEKL